MTCFLRVSNSSCTKRGHNSACFVRLLGVKSKCREGPRPAVRNCPLVIATSLVSSSQPWHLLSCLSFAPTWGVSIHSLLPRRCQGRAAARLEPRAAAESGPAGRQRKGGGQEERSPKGRTGPLARTEPNSVFGGQTGNGTKRSHASGRCCSAAPPDTAAPRWGRARRSGPSGGQTEVGPWDGSQQQRHRHHLNSRGLCRVARRWLGEPLA